MTIRDINSKIINITINKKIVGLWSHDALNDPSVHLLHVCTEGNELVFSAPTRGEAMVEAAEFFRELSKVLARMAFEQEGAVRIGGEP